MSRTLLVGPPGTNWREWMKAHRDGRPWLGLDPADPAVGPPGRLALFREDVAVWWRFYGSLDPLRAPHLIAGAVTAAPDGPLVVSIGVRPSPVLRQTLRAVAEAIRPDKIVAADGAMPPPGYPAPVERVETPLADDTVRAAQRRAQWMRLREVGERHNLPLDSLTIDGARLGSGERLSEETLRRIGLEVLHAEVCGGTLFLVADAEPSESLLARAMNAAHADRVTVAHPDAYSGLLCSLAKPNGEELGMGTVERLDFAGRAADILSATVPGAPARILRLGTLRLAPNGTELPEVRPWTL